MANTIGTTSQLIYNINWTDSTLKPSFQIQPETIDTTTTSLVLFGWGYENWGEQLQENSLHLLEHFCAPTSPSSPTDGQVWHNSDKKQLFHYYDGEWHPIPKRVMTVQKIHPADLRLVICGTPSLRS